MADKALILMDDLELAVQVNAALETAGFETAMVSPFDDTRGVITRFSPDLILLTGGLREPAVIQSVRAALDGGTPGVGLVGREDADPDALRARLGLVAILRKPIEDSDVVALARRSVERARLQARTGIIGNSPAVQEVLVKIEQIAPVSSTVLVQGESGTGKELVARAIHDLSPRRGKPFIPVNCAALPETLLESELFGHEKGAFTGAAERRLGRFEIAQGGTLFLDEIGEIPLATQVKLLRVLEERSFFRVGGTEPIRVDVRVTTATNQALEELLARGAFRDDLYYRLKVLTIYLPPLRERRSDIPILVRRFTRMFGEQHDRRFRGITAEAMQILVEAPWPGNIRQLRNLVESMVVLSPGDEIQASQIPPDIRQGGPMLLPMRITQPPTPLEGRELEFILQSLVELKLQVEELRQRTEEQAQHVEAIEVAPLGAIEIEAGARGDAESGSYGGAEVIYRPGMTMAEVERAVLRAALRETNGNRRKAAEMLQIGERTLYRKIKEFNIA